MYKPSRKLLALAMLVGTLSACHVGTTPADPPAELIYRAGDGQASFMDHVNGKFEIEDGCLFLTTDGNQRYVPIFPRKITRWDGDTLVMGSNRMDLGQPVRAGGGSVDAGAAAGFKRPDACPIKTPVWVLDASTHAR